MSRGCRYSWVLLSIVVLGVTTPCGAVQTAAIAASGPSTSDEEPINVGDSPVGYIDNAIPGTQLRFRFDAAYNNEEPGRAEFFWPKTAPRGPGVPIPETGVNYQDISAYFECALDRCSSVFGELPARFVDPDNNDNTSGLGDSTLGFKRAIAYGFDQVLSFQFKVYIPTGDGDRGLGNEHVSLEPGLLLYDRLSDRCSLNAELRYWVPIDGTEGFEGEVLRYGAGIGYDWYRSCNVSVTPVAELVAWTVLSGNSARTSQAGVVDIESAAGDTIVNAKLGVRIGFSGNQQVYAGFGQALTGDRWYDQVFRLEYRILF